MSDPKRGKTSAASTPGSFAPHERSQSEATIPLPYFIIETEGGAEHVIEAADADAALKAYLAAADLTQEGTYPTRLVQEGDENPGITVAEDLYGSVRTLEQLRAHHSSLDGYTFITDPLLEFTDAEERIDLDDVREALTASPGDGPSLVDAALDYDDPTKVNVDVMVTENLMWNDLFTEDELNEHSDIVDAVYLEWFNAEVSGDEWDGLDVTIRVQVPVEEASERIIIDRAYNMYAKYRNETDPGTYGSEYVGNEIRRRIDAAQLEAEQ